ncbi:MAG: hypothetical protein ACRDP6_34300 [Actinoallomurus sp.]
MPANDARSNIARLCIHLPLLRKAAADAGRAEELAVLVARATNGADPGAELTALFHELDVPVQGGVRGPWPWSGEGHTDTELYVCPAGRCDRRWVRRPTARVPECAVAGLPLTEDRS